jgi:hypothetical protein
VSDGGFDIAALRHLAAQHTEEPGGNSTRFAPAHIPCAEQAEPHVETADGNAGSAAPGQEEPSIESTAMTNR